MRKSIYLSINSFDKADFETYQEKADSVAIKAAALALVNVVLGRRKLVFERNSIITPLLHHFAKEFDLNLDNWVKEYVFGTNSDLPDTTNSEPNYTQFEKFDNESSDTFIETRKHIFENKNNEFSHAVFLGGGQKTYNEYLLLRKIQPEVKIVPVVSTGGASLEIATDLDIKFSEEYKRYRFLKMFRDQLEIDIFEGRNVEDNSVDLNSKVKEELVMDFLTNPQSGNMVVYKNHTSEQKNIWPNVIWDDEIITGKMKENVLNSQLEISHIWPIKVQESYVDPIEKGSTFAIESNLRKLLLNYEPQNDPSAQLEISHIWPIKVQESYVDPIEKGSNFAIVSDLRKLLLNNEPKNDLSAQLKISHMWPVNKQESYGKLIRKRLTFARMFILQKLFLKNEPKSDFDFPNLRVIVFNNLNLMAYPFSTTKDKIGS